MREPGTPGYANGGDAWDRNGDHFDLTVHDLGLEAAARALKR